MQTPPAASMKDRPVLDVEGLTTRYQRHDGPFNVIDDVSLSIRGGETLGVVGESGCGKTALALSIMRLLPASGRITAGCVRLCGDDISALDEKSFRHIRGARIGMIPQDPMVSLDPLFRVGSQIAETVRAHQPLSWDAARQRAVQLLEQVRIPDPGRRAASYPHVMSGGMRQRVVGAIGLAAAPQLLIADEPTTALDVTIQAQYLQLLGRLQAETGVALMIITHDFGVVAQMCDRAAVMYAGRVVEQANITDIFDRPKHPYTRALLGTRCVAGDDTSRRLPTIPGEPSGAAAPVGCSFAPRCERRQEVCTQQAPIATQVDATSLVRCHFPLP